MTRKESEKDSDRPHYYSQFWLDIAAGRRVIGGPKPSDEGELLDETETPEPISLHRSLRSVQDDLDESSNGRADSYTEAIVHPVVEPIVDEYSEPEAEETDIATDNIEDLDLQDAVVEDADIPDMDLGTADEDEEEEEEEEDLFDDEEEEEEDEGWGVGRGRKKAKPARPIKQPKRPTKREPRRGF